jgi:hypothetical protein
MFINYKPVDHMVAILVLDIRRSKNIDRLQVDKRGTPLWIEGGVWYHYQLYVMTGQI